MKECLPVLTSMTPWHQPCHHQVHHLFPFLWDLKIPYMLINTVTLIVQNLPCNLVTLSFPECQVDQVVKPRTILSTCHLLALKFYFISLGV